MTQGLVYVGAGRNAGVEVGTVLQMVRLGDRGVYRVAYLSSKSASARGDSTSALPALGDTVVFTPAADESVAAERAAPAGSAGFASTRAARRTTADSAGGSASATSGSATRAPASRCGNPAWSFS